MAPANLHAMPLENLTRTRIIEALNLLGEFAERDEVELEVCIYGGTAMMLAYGAREKTKDVDAIIQPASVAKRLAREVAMRLSLDETWLNDGVRRFVSESGTFAPLQIEELEVAAKRHLKITRPSASYLLAMKCMSCRAPLPGYPGDVEDIEYLIRKLSIQTMDQIEQRIERFYPHDALTPEALETIRSLLPKQGGEDK